MNIDRIFIINLEKREDRKQQMINEMEKYNITNYEFFKAIQPDMSDIIEWNNKYCEHVKSDVLPHKFNGYKIGCLGCLKSHLEVCKLSLSRGYNNVLILEDDTEFIQNFNKLNQYNELKYDMLYLAGSHLGVKDKYLSNIYKVVGTYTTGSYCINKKTMQYIVDNIQGYEKEIDVFYANNIQPKFQCYCIIPHITQQRNGYSDIQQNNVCYKLI